MALFYLNLFLETKAYDILCLRAAGPHETNPLGLHQVMFIPTIEKQGTKGQIAKFLEPAKRYEIIGTYSQTELGHGKLSICCFFFVTQTFLVSVYHIVQG